MYFDNIIGGNAWLVSEFAFPPWRIRGRGSYSGVAPC
jgi:hypothetical protein